MVTESKYRKKTICLYVAFIGLMILVLLCKKNFHVDETFSYGLANNIGRIDIAFQDGVKYEPSEVPYLDYLVVDSQGRFNYKNVWDNQTADVHPPLYYAFLHTICSIFPGCFSIWFAGIINIIFAVLTLFILRKLIYNLTGDKILQDIISIVFVLSAGILSAVTFLRMYIMAMFWVTLITYLIVTAVDKQWSWKHYSILLVVSVLGALTHYYCIVFLVFICVAFGVYLLMKKRWTEFLELVVSMLIAAGVSVTLFPAMTTHMFSGPRGTESIDNLANVSLNEYVDRLRGYYDFLNGQLFGSLLNWIIVFFLFIAILVWGKKYNNLLCIDDCDSSYDRNNVDTGCLRKQEFWVKWIVMMIPSLLYFFIVSKMAVYVTDRYIVPIYAIVLSGGICALYYGLRKLYAWRIGYLCLCIVCSAMTANGWKTIGWEYLYTDTEPLLDKTSEYEDADCLVLYDVAWKTQPRFCEISNYNSVTFVPISAIDMVLNTECINCSELMVIVISGGEELIGKVIEQCPFLEQYEKIGSYNYGTTYHLF